MEILIVFVLTLFNGLFALSEIALVSVKRHSIEQKAEAGNRKAKIVLKLLEEPEHFLSSIQIGITIIGITAGAYGAIALADEIEPLLKNIAFLSEYSSELAFLITITLITYFSIVIGELVPKSIALNNPEKIALAIGPFIRFFSIISYPLVKVLSFSTRLILKIIGVEEREEHYPNGEELVQLLKVAGTKGMIEKEESLMHQNIFSFSEQKAKSLKTHRSEVEWLDITEDIDVIRSKIKNSPYSKFPVCNENIDKVIGVITAKDFFEHYKAGLKLKDIIEEPIFIPEMMNATDVLKLFKKRKEYLGIVVDEYGSFEGIITLHDLIESIVGDLPDTEEEEDVYVREDGSHLVNGGIEINELNEFFEMEVITENSESYLTLAGFIIFFLGNIPTVGEKFEHNGYSFEIIDLDESRVDKVLIQKLN